MIVRLYAWRINFVSQSQIHSEFRSRLPGISSKDGKTLGVGVDYVGGAVDCAGRVDLLQEEARDGTAGRGGGAGETGFQRVEIESARLAVEEDWIVASHPEIASDADHVPAAGQ